MNDIRIILPPIEKFGTPDIPNIPNPGNLSGGVGTTIVIGGGNTQKIPNDILTPPNPIVPQIPTTPINISDIQKQGGGSQSTVPSNGGGQQQTPAGGGSQSTVPSGNGGGTQETLPSGTTKETLPGGGYRITNNVNGGDPLKDNPKVVSTIGSLNYTEKF